MALILVSSRPNGSRRRVSRARAAPHRTSRLVLPFLGQSLWALNHHIFQVDTLPHLAIGYSENDHQTFLILKVGVDVISLWPR
jgi:hypothetical protein